MPSLPLLPSTLADYERRVTIEIGDRRNPPEIASRISLYERARIDWQQSADNSLTDSELRRNLEHIENCNGVIAYLRAVLDSIVAPAAPRSLVWGVSDYDPLAYYNRAAGMSYVAGIDPAIAEPITPLIPALPGMTAMTSYGRLRNFIRRHNGNREQPPRAGYTPFRFASFLTELEAAITRDQDGAGTWLDRIDRANAFLHRAGMAGYELTTCDDCGAWHDEDNAVRTESGEYVCTVCRDDHYRHSDRADCYVHENDWDSSEHEYDDDDDDLEDGCIHDYSTDVLDHFPVFKLAPYEKKTATTLFMGVELEVENRDPAMSVSDRLAEGAFGILKYDGSLNDGFEIVTVPATLAYHTSDAAPWEDVLRTCREGRAKSFNTSTCGLHIHVSRAALSVLTIGKAVVFVNCPQNADFMTALAQRNLQQHSYCRANPAKTLKDGRGQFYDRYEAVNLRNDKTIEFRIFKGTLKHASVLRYIEFVHALMTYLPTASYAALDYGTFCAWVEKRGRKQYPNLLAWMLAKKYLAQRPRQVDAAEVLREAA